MVTSRRIWFASAAAALVAATAWAAEFKSGLQVGDTIGAFDVVKVAGADDDGVKNGTALCYRCRYGAKPVAVVFARKSTPALLTLVKQLDQAVASNGEKQLKSFVNFLGADQPQAEALAKAIAGAARAKKVALVVPVDFANGPSELGISPEAEVTVMLYKGGQIVSNHSYAAGTFNPDSVTEIMADLPKILN